MSSHSRARTSQTRTRGEREGGRYSSTSLSLSVAAADGSGGGVGGEGVGGDGNIANMRNASRAPSVANSRRGGTSTPFREESSTPGLSGSGGMGNRRRMSQTPLFMPRDTPFDEDEEDEEEHEMYLSALAEGRERLPSVFHPAGEGRGRGRGRGREEEEEEEDVPESVVDIGERLVRNSEIEEGVVRVQGGWEERGDGEESAVMGREELGD